MVCTQRDLEWNPYIFGAPSSFIHTLTMYWHIVQCYVDTFIADRGYLYAVFELFADSHPCGWVVRSRFTTNMHHSAKVNRIMHNGLMGVKRLICATNIYPVFESILNDWGAGQLGFDCRETQWGRRKEFLFSPSTLLFISRGGALFEGKSGRKRYRS